MISGGVIILDNDGNRIIAKYFSDDFPTLKEQKVKFLRLF